MKNSTLEEIKKSLLAGYNLLFVSHENPDGDCLGSQIALSLALEAMGKKCTIWYDEQISREKFNFLPLDKNIIYASNLDADSFDTVVVLDTPTYDCLDKNRREFLEKYTKNIINIDHHISNTYFGRLNWVESEASSVGELVYKLLKYLDCKITDDISAAIYTAIVTDTGGFRYSNTSWHTHQIVSELLQNGLSKNIEEIKNKIFDNLTEQSISLIGQALTKLRVDREYGISWCWLTRDMLKSAGATISDAEDIIKLVRSIKGIKVALLFKENFKNEQVKVSFRSKDVNIDVNKVAGIFSGGGHKAAAGCVFNEGSKQEIEDKTIAAIRKEIDALK